MKQEPFDRDSWARHYGRTHWKADPGVVAIYYLPTNAPEREIRLLEVNDQIPELRSDALEPIDFGVDTNSPTSHILVVLDVTPKQWDKIEKGKIKLPASWTLDGKVAIPSARKSKAV